MNTITFALKEELINSAKLLVDTLIFQIGKVGINLEEEYVISIDKNYIKINFFMYTGVVSRPHSLELLFLKEGGAQCIEIFVKWHLEKASPKIKIPETMFFDNNFMSEFAKVFSDTKISKRVFNKKFKELEKTA